MISFFMLVAQGYAGGTTVPSFSTNRAGLERQFLGPPTEFRCEDLFVLRPEKAEVIKFANSKFEGRGWISTFLGDRFVVAHDYDATSEYFIIRDSASGEIVGSVGYTIAEYSEKDLKRKRMTKRAPHIPVEKTLKVFPLPRPLDGRKRGIIAELRTYAIEKSFHSDVFPELISSLFESLYFHLSDYPELHDEPILYTYADETSVRMYSRMGFKLVSDKSVRHRGRDWWVMAITPRVLERLANRDPNPEILHGFNQPMPVKLRNGRTAILASHAMFMNEEYLRSKNFGRMSQIITELDQPLEVEPGIWAAKGSSVAWYKNGQLAYVTKLDSPLPVEIFTASAGSKIIWSEAGKLVEIGDLAESKKVAPGIYAAAHASVSWSADNGKILSVTELEKKAQIAPGIWAAKGARVFWQLPDNQVSYVSELGKNSNLEKNSNLGLKIIGAVGSDVSWIYDWNLRRPRVNSVSEIAEISEVTPGIWAAIGASYISNHNPLKTPAVSKLARPFLNYKEGDSLPYNLDISK